MKNNKKLKTALIVFIVILALVLCFNVGVYAAYALAATEVSYTKPGTSTTISVKDALDELNKKIPTKSIGDEVTVGGEQFYVLEWDNNCDTVNLISKYNLNTAGTAQSSTSVFCKFSTNNYWKESFISPETDLNDIAGYTASDVMGKIKNYGKSKGAIVSRLLSYEEATKLKKKAFSDDKIATMLRSEGKQSYWTSTAENADLFIYVVQGSTTQYESSFITTIPYSATSGMRPVITILKSKVS